MANGSPATHQTLQQQGGTGEDSHVHLADRTLSIAAIEKKKKKAVHRSHTNIACKRRRQVTAKHAYTLRMWLCMK